MLTGVLLAWYAEVSGLAGPFVLAGLFVNAFSEFWTAVPPITPLIMSLAMVAGLWWFFSRKDQ
jgi:hypothetical protein